MNKLSFTNPQEGKICVLFSGVKRDIWEIEKVHGFVPIESTGRGSLTGLGSVEGFYTGVLGEPPFPEVEDNRVTTSGGPGEINQALNKRSQYFPEHRGSPQGELTEVFKREDRPCTPGSPNGVSSCRLGFLSSSGSLPFPDLKREAHLEIFKTGRSPMHARVAKRGVILPSWVSELIWELTLSGPQAGGPS